MAKKQASTARRQDSSAEEARLAEERAHVARCRTAEFHSVVGKALARGHGTDDAQHMLWSALDTLRLDVWLAAIAYHAVVPAGRENFQSALIAISARAEALRDYVTENLDVAFMPAADPND